jgi:hypothetical protein
MEFAALRFTVPFETANVVPVVRFKGVVVPPEAATVKTPLPLLVNVRAVPPSENCPRVGDIVFG